MFPTGRRPAAWRSWTDWLPVWLPGPLTVRRTLEADGQHEVFRWTAPPLLLARALRITALVLVAPGGLAVTHEPVRPPKVEAGGTWVTITSIFTVVGVVPRTPPCTARPVSTNWLRRWLGWEPAAPVAAPATDGEGNLRVAQAEE